MTSHAITRKWLRPTLCSLALAASASFGYGQGANDFIVSQFDNDTLQGWAGNYGNAPFEIIHDPTEDRGPGAAPGSMKITINFDLCANPVQNQRDWEVALASALDLTKYTRLHFSVKVDPSSSRLSDWGAGAFGGLRPHIRRLDWSGDSNLGNNPADIWIGAEAYDGEWRDYSYPIDQTLDNQSVREAMGVWGFDMWAGWGSCAMPIGHTNTVIFWMDNIWFEAETNAAPPAPPTLTLEKVGAAGVQITMDNVGDQWQRDAIVTPASTGPYHWTAQGVYPVTYSMTLADFPAPGTGHTGFEAHMYIINQDTSNGNETYGGADWNVPDIFILRIENGDTDVSATIQWKTNSPNSNPPEGALNNPAVVNVPDAKGTWTVTFSNATDGTLTGPGGVSTNFSLPEEAVLNNFSPFTSFIQFGIFKNDGPNDGHNNQIHGTYSRVMFDGPIAPFDDDFGGTNLTEHYAWRTTSSSAVQFVPPGTAWEVTWSLPDAGFNLVSASSISGPYNPAGASSTYQAGGVKHALIPASALPGANANYFALVKRPFSKLQILLPGETAAPNTTTGKTGTPTEPFFGVPFNVVVNAVDEYWNRVSSTDTINITSSDAAATLPADAALVNGSATFSVTLNNSGTFTITASDVTDPTKTASTSSPVTVP